MLGKIHSIESFGAVDGPGIRYIFFLHGCPLRCQFCHNPDTWGSNKFMEMSSDEAIEKALRYKTYWGDTGGITVSGGEPLVQIDFLIELFKKAKEHDINTCIDTSGGCFNRNEPFFSKFNELMRYTDLLMVDIKHIDNEQHKILTGVGNENILDMIKYLNDINKPIWIRHVLVPMRNDYDEYLIRLNNFIKSLNNVKKVEVLPYHTLGVFKWEQLGIPYKLEGINPPSQERIDNANILLNVKDYIY